MRVLSAHRNGRGALLSAEFRPSRKTDPERHYPAMVVGTGRVCSGVPPPRASMSSPVARFQPTLLSSCTVTRLVTFAFCSCWRVRREILEG